MRVPPPKPRDGETIRVIPAGLYLIGLVYFNRKTGRSGNPFLNSKYQVIHGVQGQNDGDFFWSSIGITDSCMGRLQVYQSAVRGKTGFDTDSDHDMWKAFVGKAFQADLESRDNSGYESVEISRYITERMSMEDQDACSMWEEAYGNGRGSMEDPDDRGGSRSAPEYDAPPPAESDRLGDDDIPF